MSRNWQRDRLEFDRLIERSLQIVVWLGVAVGLVWVLMAHDVMRVVYGPEFSVAGPVLALFGVVCVMAVISGHYRFGLIAAGEQKKEMVTSGLGAVVALIFIPIGYYRWGIVGASLGLVAAEALVWFSSWIYGRRLLGLNGHAKFLVRPLVAVSISSCVWFLPIVSLTVRAIVALVALCVLAFVIDSTVRSRLGDLIALGHSWSERRTIKAIAKAADRVNA
jgi:O-antigen/teichoic acid export membrane protein